RGASLLDPVVIEPHQLDHVVDVGLGLDPARGRPFLVREYRVMDDTAILVQALPQVPREEEMCCVVAVQVSDLARADLERELSAAAVTGLNALPGRDLFGDLLAGCLCAGHRVLL